MADVSDGRSLRRALYVVFARLFAGPPDPELFGKIARGSLQTLARAQGLDLTGDLVDSLDPLASSAELQAEYARLFHDVSLRASDYASGSGDPVAAVAGFLREHALALDASSGLPCDHLSVALGIMGQLAGGTPPPGEGRSERDRARAFLERHLLSWVPDALAEVAEHADRRFYRGLAAMLLAFLASEKRLYEAAA
jgi:TorA maturation chaperone TorD